MDYTQEIKKLQKEVTEVSLRQKRVESFVQQKTSIINTLVSLLLFYVSTAALLYVSNVQDALLKALIIPATYIVSLLINRFIINRE